MHKSALALLFWVSIIPTIVYAAEEDLHFRAASALHARGASIAELMTTYKPAIRAKGTEQRQADLALLWTIAETGSVCAILGGNVIGAGGLMDSRARSDFKERISGSVDVCVQFIHEKVRFLGALAKARNDQSTVEFARALDVQMRALEKNLTDFEAN